jgi:hypothetical protein
MARRRGIISGEYESAMKIAEMSRMQRNRIAREEFRVGVFFSFIIYFLM